MWFAAENLQAILVGGIVLITNKVGEASIYALIHARSGSGFLRPDEWDRLTTLKGGQARLSKHKYAKIFTIFHDRVVFAFNKKGNLDFLK